MIIVCEPQCQGISHVSVNSGFIYGLRHAYPRDQIHFLSDKSHCNEVRRTLNRTGSQAKWLKNNEIIFNPNIKFSLSGILQYYFLIKSIFDHALSHKVQKILFLSISPIILFGIKLLKKSLKYKDICCTFVLHGELEDIANAEYKEPYISVIRDKTFIYTNTDIRTKIFRTVDLVRSLLYKLLTLPFTTLMAKYSLIYKRIFRTKKMMVWRHSNQYNYISLSPHVTKNAKKYLDVDYLNFHTVIMPILFKKPISMPKNKFIKFAIYGYGDSAQLNNMLKLLSKREISKPYEIRIISMDCKGSEGHQNVNCISDGKALPRVIMERSAKDIDVFINLYDSSRHKLGCSLSIFEALSHIKPVLHLSNPGYNYFNKAKKPIGFRVNNLSEFVGKMVNLIEEYEVNRKILTTFRENILDYRIEYNIKNNLIALKRSLIFSNKTI